MADKMNAQKTRGAWEICVKGTSTGQSASAGHGKCGTRSIENIAHDDERKKNKKEG